MEGDWQGLDGSIRPQRRVSPAKLAKPPCPRGTTTPAPQCQASLDAERLDTKLAIASYVAAGVFAVTWLALQLTEPPRPASHGARALAAPLCAPSFTGLGMACALRF